ncbi:MAG: C45 family autoproteolytic acyltransferase/hydrolase [Candidatus Saganbacteria bacterium]|nr:C45 family autoproteolytic acyltransferase/hydrolase [Candidatus Saganbacteria bacterium]
MRKTVLLFCVFGLFAVSFFLSSCGGLSLRKAAVFEGGILYRTANDKFYVPVLKGSWREMGRQYGGLLKPQLNEFYNSVTDYLTSEGISYKDQKASAYALFNTYTDRRLKELVYGMAETSGLGNEKQIMVNAAFMNLAQYAGIWAEKANKPKTKKGCSGVAVWDNYSHDGKMIFGRDWDFYSVAYWKRWLPSLTIAVFNPDDGSNSVADIEFLGSIFTETAINNKGIFAELNNGMQSDPTLTKGRTQGPVSLLSFMFDCSTIDEFEKTIEKTPDDVSYIIQVAGKDAAYSFEWPTWGVRRRSEKESGYLVAYNSFVRPLPVSWEKKVPPPVPQDTRRNNLLSLVSSKKYKGRIDVPAMKEILGISWEAGGSTHGGTAYQVITAPGDQTVWLKGIGYSDWEKIDLKPLFRRKT